MEIGDKVVCINANIDEDKKAEIASYFFMWITKGVTYTVRDILHNDGIVVGILLEEIHNFPIYISLIKKTQEPAFADWRFSKQEKITESISVEKELSVTL